MSYFFNASIQVPQGSNLALENSSGNKLFFDSNSSMASSYNLVFPSTDGTNGQALLTDGSGNLRFETISTSVGSVASNGVINSTAGNIIFTTDDGDVDVSTDSGNLTISSNGSGNQLVIGSKNGDILFGNGENLPLDRTDVSNLALIISGNQEQFIGSTYRLIIANDTQATGEFDAAISISGGADIAKNLYVGGNVNAISNVNVSESVDVSGNLVVDGTSTLTGLVSAGANVDVTGNVNVSESVDVSGNLVVDGTSTLGVVNAVSLTLSGNLVVNGTTTTINSNVTTIDDPVIQLGTGGVNDSFDRGIKALHNDNKMFFGWSNAGNHFTFIPDATFSSSNVATGTEGDAYFAVLTANSSTQSSSTSTGALIVSGGAGVGKNLYVGGNVNVSETTTLTGQTNINNKLVVALNEFNDSVGTTTDIWNGSNSATNKHLLLNTSNVSNYSTSSGVTGQLLNIFFTNNSSGSASANLDFGSNNLYSGSGIAQYLVFNTTGQSASLVYVDASGSNDGWRIINTGAQVF